MAKFLSGRQKSLKLGIDSYTEDKISLEVVGKVGIGSTIPSGSFDVVGESNFRGQVTLGSTVTVSSGSTFNFLDGSAIHIAGIAGSEGQYIKSTGVGITWSNFPSLRSGISTVAVPGQSIVNTSYNVNFVDVFLNGVLLDPSEYTATNGSSIIFNDSLEGGETINIFAYNTISAYGGAGSVGGGGGLVDSGSGGYWQQGVVLGIHTFSNVGIFSESPTSALSVQGDIKVSGVVTASSFIGDGSGLSGIVATGSGVEIRDDGALVGTAATIDFGRNIDVSPIYAGIVTVSRQRDVDILLNGTPIGIATGLNFGSNLEVDVTNLGIATITASGGGGGGSSGIEIQDGGSSVGTGITILNFGTNLTVSLNPGGDTAEVSATGGGGGGTYSETSGIATVATYTSIWSLDSADGIDYTISGPGIDGSDTDPTLYLVRGQKYKFVNNTGGHPFRIQSTPNGSVGTQYNDGITNNDVQSGEELLWDVNFTAPSVLYYQCTSHNDMGGVIRILDENIVGINTSDTSTFKDVRVTGIITANQINTQSGGTPTISSPNNLNLNANNVAISTNASIGGNATIQGTLTLSNTLTTTSDVSVGVDTSSGIILTSALGTQYRLIVLDDGSLSTVAVQ